MSGGAFGRGSVPALKLFGRSPTLKRTNFVTNLISLLLFGAMLLYLGVYLIRSMSNDIRTAPAVYVELTDSAAATGMIVRDETLVVSGESYLSLIAETGRLLAAGETIAVAYSSEDALSRAGKIRELELQRQYILAALSDDHTGATVSQKDAAIKRAVTELSAAAARHSSEDLSAASITLASLVMEDPEVHTTEVDLSLVTDQLNQLRQTASSDTIPIKASSPGVFFSAADGFEYVSPERVKDISPSSLREMTDSPQSTPEDVIGKLADPLEWYYAALVSRETAERLKAGETATLDFGRYCAELLQATVISVKMDEDEAAVVFRCTSAAADMLAVRNASASILFGITSGIRVPTEAIYAEEVEQTDAAGQTITVEKKYVFTVTGLQAEKKYINIVWESEDYCLAEPADSADAAALREGNDIILTKRDIQDGMLLD